MIESEYQCQWCGTIVTTSVDPAAGQYQQTIEDCERCCRPNVLSISIERDLDSATIDAQREND